MVGGQSAAGRICRSAEITRCWATEGLSGVVFITDREPGRKILAHLRHPFGNDCDLKSPGMQMRPARAGKRSNLLAATEAPRPTAKKV